MKNPYPVETQMFQASGYEFTEALRQLAIAQARAEDVESVYMIMQQVHAVHTMISRLERRFPGGCDEQHVHPHP